MVLFTLRSQSFYYRSKAGRDMSGMDDIHWIFSWFSVPSDNFEQTMVAIAACQGQGSYSSDTSRKEG